MYCLAFFEPYDDASARRQMDGKGVLATNEDILIQRIIGCITIGIHSIAADRGLIGGFLVEEVEWEGEVACGPVGHASYEPAVVLFPGGEDVFGYFSIQYAGIIPGGRDAAEQFHESRLLHTLGRVAGEDLHRVVVYHEHGQLMTAGALAHDHAFDGPESFLGSIV